MPPKPPLCELCNKRPALVHLTVQDINEYACLQCTAWAREAIEHHRIIMDYVLRRIEQEAIMDIVAMEKRWEKGIRVTR